MVIFSSERIERSGLRESKEAPFSALMQDGFNALGYLAGETLDMLCSEDAAYEYFCDIADALIGAPITAIARFDAAQVERSALFRSRVRAIYRASVWGQFSLLCTGISTPAELAECTDILGEAFCELESEGREFNGFIEKGICVDTPIMLYNFPQRPRFDFLCFDAQKLRYLCTGVKGSDIGMKEMTEAIAKICRENEKCGIAIKVDTQENAEKTLKMLSMLEISKIYICVNTLD